jgi:(methylthio)acryloyl-CoA hydratase
MNFSKVSGLLASLDQLSIESSGAVLHIRLFRPAKRNAISDILVQQLHTAFINLPTDTKVVVLSGEGDHFCAGLDLAEVGKSGAEHGMWHSLGWHKCFDAIQFGTVPVISVLHGAIVGGGLELAAASHIRIAEPSSFFALPEGTRGLFVGGGGSVRIPRLIGVARMTDMMLTGRVYEAEEAHQIGLAQYKVAEGEGLKKAFELAGRISGNSPMSNFAIMQALPRIADQSMEEGMLTESLMAAISQSTDDARERLQAFLNKRAAKVERQS